MGKELNCPRARDHVPWASKRRNAQSHSQMPRRAKIPGARREPHPERMRSTHRNAAARPAGRAATGFCEAVYYDPCKCTKKIMPSTLRDISHSLKPPAISQIGFGTLPLTCSLERLCFPGSSLLHPIRALGGGSVQIPGAAVPPSPPGLTMSSKSQ